MKRTDFLYLNSRDEFFRIDLNSLVYFEADGNYTRFVVGSDYRGMVGRNLASMQDLLKERLGTSTGKFARTGKRYIINLAYVAHIAILKQELTLSDGKSFTYRISVSKDALKKLRDLFLTQARQPAAPLFDEPLISKPEDDKC